MACRQDLAPAHRFDPHRAMTAAAHASDPLIPLGDDAIVILSGSDALAFAQAQFVNDVRELGDGQWQWSGWLTPKGRLIAFFALVRLTAERCLLWLPAGGAALLRERLQRFVFRSRVGLATGATWQALGVAAGPVEADAGAVSITLPGAGAGPRTVLLREAPDESVVTANAHALARWHLADLDLGLPHIACGLPNSEQFIPQWLSLQRLSAFSIGKGCYPGQEIVARMHFLGQSKRSAYLIAGAGKSPPAMTRIIDGQGSSQGDVVWSLDADGTWRALAVLADAAVASSLTLDDGRPVTLRGPTPILA
jgi:tRNA-modifying protein YgfZ